MSASPTIELGRVRAGRGGRVILDGLDLCVAAGERVALIGQNGVGKSTLLDVVLGLLPAEGHVRVLGARPPAAGVGFVGQDPDASLMPWLTVQENVELPLRLRGVSAGARERAFEEVRTLLDPHERVASTRRPRSLSGGERQRVALMRAWIGAPRLVVLDEPLSAVDPLTRVRTREAMLSGSARWPETSVLFVSHDLADVLSLATRAVVLGGAPASVHADVAIDPGSGTKLLRALEEAERAGAPSRREPELGDLSLLRRVRA